MNITRIAHKLVAQLPGGFTQLSWQVVGGLNDIHTQHLAIYLFTVECRPHPSISGAPIYYNPSSRSYTKRSNTVLLKMDSILKAFDLGSKDLDFKCPRKIRDRIASEIIDEWYLIGRELDVSHKKLKSIRSDITLTLPDLKAIAVLDAWGEEHGGAATCLKLAEALHNRRMMHVLEILCEEVKRLTEHDKTTPSAQLREEVKKEKAEATATDGESGSHEYS